MSLALRHIEADRVPKGEICVAPGIANALLGKQYPSDYLHYQREKEVREFLNMDFVNLGDWPEEEIGTDEGGNRKFLSNYGYEFVTNGRSKRITKPAVVDIENVASYRIPDIRRVSGALVSEFSRTADFFVFAQIGGPVSMLDEMFPIEDYLVYCMTNPSEIRLITEKVMEYELAKARLFLDCGADAIFLADDIAYNSGLFLPPRAMEALVYPFYRQVVDEIKRYKPVPVVFHSDGDINGAMDRLVSCGFDGLQSLQPSAGMDIVRIKRDYGDALCLIGNIDLDYVMTFAPPEAVADTVRRTIDAAAPAGGFVLSTCNTLVDAIPPENALAMYRTADEYGVYADLCRRWEQIGTDKGVSV